jgi:hypothetical protein
MEFPTISSNIENSALFMQPFHHITQLPAGCAAKVIPSRPPANG